MALVLVTNGWGCCTYPYNGGESCCNARFMATFEDPKVTCQQPVVFNFFAENAY